MQNREVDRRGLVVIAPLPTVKIQREMVLHKAGMAMSRPQQMGKPTAKGVHSWKSSGAESRSLKKVLSDLMKGMRKVRRSIKI